MEALVNIAFNGPQMIAFRGLKWLYTKNRRLTLGVVIVVAVVKIRKAIKRRQRRKEWENAGRDVAVLHGLSRGTRTPSASPFVMKLATYLRLAQIEYKVDYTEPFGPKGKSPWITFNGKHLGDSQLIMDYLGNHFNKDLSSHLSEDQKSVAWTFAVMVDEHLAWGLKDWRWVLDGGRGVMSGVREPLPWKWMVMFRNRRLQSKLMKVQGIGRHSHEEIKQFIIRDLKAISTFLGTKRFLMGEDPCEVDCSVFGCLVQVKYNYPGSPYTAMMENEFANLGAYVIRMKERLWPDWDQCLDKKF